MEVTPKKYFHSAPLTKMEGMAPSPSLTATLHILQGYYRAFQNQTWKAGIEIQTFWTHKIFGGFFNFKMSISTEIMSSP